MCVCCAAGWRCATAQEHWFTLRRVADGEWWNFNSLFPAPQPLSTFYLTAFLDTLRGEGWTIFVVRDLGWASSEWCLDTGCPLTPLTSFIILCNQSCRPYMPVCCDVLPQIRGKLPATQPGGLETLPNAGKWWTSEDVSASERGGERVLWLA